MRVWPGPFQGCHLGELGAHPTKLLAGALAHFPGFRNVPDALSVRQWALSAHRSPSWTVGSSCVSGRVQGRLMNVRS